MARKYLPVALAGVLGLVTTVVRSIVPLTLNLNLIDVSSPTVFTLLQQVSGLVNFLLVYGLLFGVAYWAGTAVRGRQDHLAIAALSGVLAGIVIFLTTVVLTLAGMLSGPGDLVTTVLLAVGPPVGTGVKFAVVVLAGTALRSLE